MRVLPRRKEKGRHTFLGILLCSVLLIVGFSAYLTYNYLTRSTDQNAVRPRAVIIDQLSLLNPNQTFVEATTSILQQAGFDVDYHGSEEVTVEFYRNLPQRQCSLVVLRVHSVTHGPGANYTGLFTSELFEENEYEYEIENGLVGAVVYEPSQEESARYFAITSRFVTASMLGSFDDSIVIAMGCWTMTYPDLAQAFISKGASTYIGWTDSVLLNHTDTATTVLLEHLITQKQAPEQAITNTINEIGADPITHAVLSCGVAR